MRIEQCWIAALELEIGVVAAADAHVDAGRGPLKTIRRLAGVLEGLPTDLEQKPLLRVHPLGLARRDAEKARIEIVDRLQKATITRRDSTRSLGIGIIELISTPTIGWNLADRIDAIAHQPPKAGGIVTAAGYAAAKPNHRDRLARGCLQGCDTRLSLLKRQKCALERRQSWSICNC